MPDQTAAFIKWIKHSLGTENISVEFGITLGKGEGYLSDIIFAKIVLEENGKELHLAIKVSKTLPGIREHLADFCKREVLFYNEIMPIFNQFQKERDIKKPFDAIPKCYKAFCTEETEVMVLEDLKALGYEMLEKTVTLNKNHIKLTLQNYAKFHALSLALKDQKSDTFSKLEKYPNLLIEKMITHRNFFSNRKCEIVQNLNEIGREDLAEKYHKLVDKEIMDMLLDLMNDEPDVKVVTQTDCNCGNILFKYEDSKKECPSHMVFIDFQQSNLLSPMIDIGVFWYNTASKEEFAHFTDMLEFYHNELASFLTQLGSDVNKLYPISKMWDHWKKYSLYGFLVTTSCLKLLYVNKEDTPNLGEMESDVFNFKMQNSSPYLKRLGDVIEHFFNIRDN